MKNKSDAQRTLARFHFDPWNMAGPAIKETRRNLILDITGERRPLAKCGVTEIIKALSNHVDFSKAGCLACYPREIEKFFLA